MGLGGMRCLRYPLPTVTSLRLTPAKLGTGPTVAVSPQREARGGSADIRASALQHLLAQVESGQWLKGQVVNDLESRLRCLGA
jgi:hypothetical protein